MNYAKVKQVDALKKAQKELSKMSGADRTKLEQHIIDQNPDDSEEEQQTLIPKEEPKKEEPVKQVKATKMLTDANKYRVIFDLCYPGTVLTPNNVNFNSIVRDRLDIDNEYIEARVIVLLDQIDLIKTKLSESPTKNNVKEIGDIVFDTSIGFDLIRKEYNRLVGELSSLLNLPSQCKTGSTRNVSVCL